MKNKIIIVVAVVLVIILALIVIKNKKPTVIAPVIDNTVQNTGGVNVNQGGPGSPENVAKNGMMPPTGADIPIAH